MQLHNGEHECCALFSRVDCQPRHAILRTKQKMISNFIGVQSFAVNLKFATLHRISGEATFTEED